MGEALIAGAGVLLLLVVALVTLAAVAARRRERRRTDRLHRWAHEHGWTVTPHPAVDWGTRLPGGNRDGITVMLSSRVQGRPVSVAEYTVTDTQLTTAPDGTGGTTTSTTTSTHYYTVTVAALARSMPPTAVEPSGAMSRLARTVLRPGECATGNAVFDRRFRIRTSDPAAVHGWCTPQLIAAHLDGHLPAWSTYATELFTYQTGRLDPTTIPHHTSQVVLLAALLDQTAT